MAERELQPVRAEDGRRQMLVSCPACGQRVAFWLCIQPPGEYVRTHPVTDLTAALSAPDRRAEAMRRAADIAEKSTATPWVCCTFCGYDDHYVISPPSGWRRD